MDCGPEEGPTFPSTRKKKHLALKCMTNKKFNDRDILMLCYVQYISDFQNMK